MKNWLFFGFFLALSVAACAKVEVDSVQVCRKVVERKYLADKFLGVMIEGGPKRYIQLEDGVLVQNDPWDIERRIYSIGENYCQTEYREIKSLKTDQKPIGVPCPKEKCPEMYDKAS